MKFLLKNGYIHLSSFIYSPVLSISTGVLSISAGVLSISTGVLSISGSAFGHRPRLSHCRANGRLRSNGA